MYSRGMNLQEIRAWLLNLKKSWDGIQAFHLFLESNPYLTFP